jgi:FG-GAP repeat
LTPTGDQIWHQNSGQSQDSPVLSSVAEAGDNFGASLTSGDFNGDGIDDLAVGSPDESVGTVEDAGAATAIYGSTNGLTATGHQTWHQDSTGILDEAETSDRFSASLTSGDFNDDGIDDLAVGVYSEDIDDIDHAGAVNVIYGSTNRLGDTGNQFWSQNSAGIQGNSEFGDYFGWSVTSGDFDGDGIDDLGVGVPLEESDSNSTNAGAVNILRGSVDRLTGLDDRYLSQNTLDLADNPSEAHDRFAWSLTAGDFNGDGHSDLAVGVPYEDIGSITDAGEVNVFYDV